MTLRKILLPALAVLLLSSAGMRRVAQGQTTTTGLSGSWIGVITLPPGVDNGEGGSTIPVMLVYNSNGTVALVVEGTGSGSDKVGAGTWVSTVNGQFAQTAIAFRYDNNGNYNGNSKVRLSVSVSGGQGGQMSGNGEVILYDATGAIQGDITGITFTATPIAVETVGSM